MTRPVTITLTITAPDMGAVRDWLREHSGSAPRAAGDALWRYAFAVLVSNSEWDGVPVTVTRKEAGG